MRQDLQLTSEVESWQSPFLAVNTMRTSIVQVFPAPSTLLGTQQQLPQMIVDYRLYSPSSGPHTPVKVPGMWWGDVLINQLDE